MQCDSLMALVLLSSLDHQFCCLELDSFRLIILLSRFLSRLGNLVSVCAPWVEIGSGL